MLVKLAVALLVLSVLEQVVGSDNIDIHDSLPEKPASQKGRLSLQNTAEIQHCLVSAGDVGCGVFECFENNSCEIRGLQEICMTFLHNAGKFDSQGKSFIKDALKCMAHGLRHKFSCISRKCVSIKEMVFQLQRECYIKHNLCSAAKENVAVMVEMIHFQDLFPKGPYVELVNILLSCGEEVKEALTRSVRLQCEQNWGALCDSLSLCSSLAPRGRATRRNLRRRASTLTHATAARAPVARVQMSESWLSRKTPRPLTSGGESAGDCPDLGHPLKRFKNHTMQTYAHLHMKPYSHTSLHTRTHTNSQTD